MIGGLALDIGKTVNPLYLWGMELSYTIPELLSAQQIGRPVDEQKLAGIKLKWNMDVDQMAYIGSTEVGKYGLCNSDQVSAGFVATNGGSPALTQWIYKTADQILYDINALLETTWAASGYAVCPSKLLLPPAQFAYITSQKVSSAGNISILKAGNQAGEMAGRTRHRSRFPFGCNRPYGGLFAGEKPCALSARAHAANAAGVSVPFPSDDIFLPLGCGGSGLRGNAGLRGRPIISTT